jgi:hypothetical protein
MQQLPLQQTSKFGCGQFDWQKLSTQSRHSLQQSALVVQRPNSRLHWQAPAAQPPRKPAQHSVSSAQASPGCEQHIPKRQPWPGPQAETQFPEPSHVKHCPASQPQSTDWPQLFVVTVPHRPVQVVAVASGVQQLWLWQTWPFGPQLAPGGSGVCRHRRSAVQVSVVQGLPSSQSASPQHSAPAQLR